MHTNPLELLGVGLFRFAPLPRIWAIALMAVNACCLFFIGSIYGQVALVALVAGVTVMAVIYMRLD